MFVTTKLDLVRNVLNLEHMGTGPEIGNKCSAACDASYIAFVGQLAQRAIGCHARHVHRFHELVLGRHAIGRAQLATRDAAYDQVLELLVHRLCCGAHDATPIRSSVAA